LRPDKTTKKPKAGLPPLVKALTDQISLEPGLEPNEIFREISVFFRMDPLWASAETCACLKLQINQRIRCMRKKSPNQLKIEFTHDMLKFKETYKLKLPPDHIARPILSEVLHLAELARSYEKRGELHGFVLRGLSLQNGTQQHPLLITLQHRPNIRQHPKQGRPVQ
jgi:hypothetical protein